MAKLRDLAHYVALYAPATRSTWDLLMEGLSRAREAVAFGELHVEKALVAQASSVFGLGKRGGMIGEA